MPPDTDRSPVCGTIDTPRKTTHHTPTRVGGNSAVSGCEVGAVRRARPGTHNPDRRTAREVTSEKQESWRPGVPREPFGEPVVAFTYEPESETFQFGGAHICGHPNGINDPGRRLRSPTQNCRNNRIRRAVPDEETVESRRRHTTVSESDESPVDQGA
jgi:hypothetical protein